MKSMNRSLCVLLVLCLMCCLAFPVSLQAAPIEREEFAKMLREALRDNPDMVLDVLRSHSETVLDIAQQGSDQRVSKKLQAQWRLDMQQPKQVALEDRPIRGTADAPVTIVAFSDFTCPYCRQAESTLRALMERHSGKIKFVFKHLPLKGRKNSDIAAMYHIAATFQDPEKAWKLYDLLFAGGPRIAEEGEPFIKAMAEEAGLDMKQLAAEMKKATRVNTILNEDMDDARRLGIDGTPNFLVNNLIVRGALPLDFFSEAVSMALSEAKK